WGGEGKERGSGGGEPAKLKGKLVSDLESTLNQLADPILREVRTISAEHEARRASLLNELQSLAMKLDGSFPASPSVSSGGGSDAISKDPQPKYISDAQRQEWLPDALTRHLQSERLPAPSAG